MREFGITVQVDDRGRVLLPKKVKEALRLGPGDTVFLKYESESQSFVFAKINNPFDLMTKENRRGF